MEVTVRQKLESALRPIESYNLRESQLLLELRAVRAQRAAFDNDVYDIITQCEVEGLGPADWRGLLDGVHRIVSESLARHAMRDV